MKFIAQGKGTVHSIQAIKAQWGSRCIALLFNPGSCWGWVVNITPRSLYRRYPLYKVLDGHQGQSGRVQKISPPPGPAPRTIQFVMSRSHKGNTCSIDSSLSFPFVNCCINPLKKKRRLLYLKNHFVPRSNTFQLGYQN
jgi:hypothetical protein